jgi:hypothetical protein
MTTFVFIPGAGGVPWYWHRVMRLLEEAQHESVAVDLPGDDEHAGLSAYADRVLEAIGTRHASSSRSRSVVSRPPWSVRGRPCACWCWSTR